MLPGGKSDNYSDLMSLVQAQQTRLQSQQAEIKHVSIVFIHWSVFIATINVSQQLYCFPNQSLCNLI